MEQDHENTSLIVILTYKYHLIQNNTIDIASINTSRHGLQSYLKSTIATCLETIWHPFAQEALAPDVLYLMHAKYSNIAQIT